MKKFSSLTSFFKCVTRNLTHIVTYVCFLGIIKSGSCQYWKDSSSNYGNFDENIVSIISNFPMNWNVGLLVLQAVNILYKFIFFFYLFHSKCLNTRQKLHETQDKFTSIQDTLLNVAGIECETKDEDCSRILFLSQGGYNFILL